MKKALSIIVMLFCIQSIRRQTLHQKIKGVLVYEKNFKYAYLQDANKGILVTNIVNDSFEFIVAKNGKFDLRTLSLAIDSIDRKPFSLKKLT